MTHLESRKMMEAAALTKARSGYGNVSDTSEAGALIVPQRHSCFFSAVGGSISLLFPVFPIFLDMEALPRSTVNCCNGDLLSVKCGLYASNSWGKINIMSALWRHVSAPDSCGSHDISGVSWTDSCLDFSDWDECWDNINRPELVRFQPIWIWIVYLNL